MSKNKEDNRFKRKINAICIDFRFYSKQKKNAIIKPCLDEYHKQLSAGISSTEAAQSITKNCREKLERKYEKHNKYLSLLIFSIVFCVFTFGIEYLLFSTLFENAVSYIVWTFIIFAILLFFTIWQAVTHSGRWFHYLFLIILMVCLLLMALSFINVAYLNQPSDYLKDIDFKFTNPFIVNITQYVGDNVPRDKVYITNYNLDTIGSLGVLVISLICYFAEHATINKYYPKIVLKQLCTQYGKTFQVDKVKTKQEGLTYYYSLIDSGISDKDAYTRTISLYESQFGITHQKNNRYLFSLCLITCFLLVILGYSLIYVFSDSYTAWTGGLLGFYLGVLIVLFVIMIAMHSNLYWYDYVFAALMIVLLVLEIVAILQAPDHVDNDLSILYYKSYFPLYNVEFMEYADGETLSQQAYYIPSYCMIGAIVMEVIIIPLFCVRQHRINKKFK